MLVSKIQIKTYRIMTGTNQQQVLSKLEQLEQQVKELTKSRDYWEKRNDETSRKFNAFRDSIKSIIVLVD